MKIKIVVPISGGKDSQSCLKLATQNYHCHEILGLFCDTKFEHPETYNHIEKLKYLYGPINILTINGGNVLDKCLKYKRFPGGGARFCTDELKIRESKIFYKNLALSQNKGFEVWYGMRSNESPERTKRYMGKISNELYPPHEVIRNKFPKYLFKLGVTFRLPIVDWTEADVFTFLNGEENNLYKKGFERVGCFPCLASGDKYKEKCFNYDTFGKEQLFKIKELEQIIGKSIWTSKSGKIKNDSFCSFCNI